MCPSVPEVSVVVNTYNRAAQVGKAVESVLGQPNVRLELLVVDDGSTDDTPAVLAAMSDARIRCIRQNNRGLSASRNVGARHARGDWLLFLDDDDRLCECALEALLLPTADPACQVVVGGVRFVDGNGQLLHERLPASVNDALAGTFLISRKLFQKAGGYLDGMPCSHQTELFLRVCQVLDDPLAAVSYVPTPVVEIESRPAACRPQRSPSNAYFGARWLLARHPDQYTSRRTRATMETIVGVNAMRMARTADARRRFASAVRHDPLSAMRYFRLGAALVSPIGRRIWLRQWDTAPQTQRSLDRVRRFAYPDGSPDGLPLERDSSPGPDSLFLPWRYRENKSVSSEGAAPPVHKEDRPGDDRCDQAPIYRLAAQLARSRSLEPVADIGCGSGHNLVRYVGKVTSNFVGFDQPSRISVARHCFPDETWVGGDLDDEAIWHEVSSLKPQLIISAGVVERVVDPRRMLSGIRYALSERGVAVISTPDRNRLQPQTALGPPTNPHHIREWSAEEFALLLESCGLQIFRLVRRLPRALSTSMVFVVQASAAV